MELYSGPVELEPFQKWVETEIVPSYSILSKKDLDKVYGKKIPAYLCFLRPGIDTLETDFVK